MDEGNFHKLNSKNPKEVGYVFPYISTARLRKNENLRRMIRETKLSRDDFIYPLFLTQGRGVRREISSMPGIAQISIDLAVKEVTEARQLGIPAVILFGIPKKKDPQS